MPNGIGDFLPTPPSEGPPLPKGLGQKWPGKTSSPVTKLPEIFIADIRKAIPDEKLAHDEYTRMSLVAKALGQTEISNTLLAIASDEARHQKSLEDILTKTGR